MSETQSPLTIQTSAAVVAHALVKTASAKVLTNTAASTDMTIGVAQFAAANGDYASVKLLSDSGTIEMIAAGVISAGADVYAAAAGKVQAIPTAGGKYRKIGIALEAAGADGDIITVLPHEFNTFLNVAETILASGALSIVDGVESYLDSAAGAITGTLADGTYVGQLKHISMQGAANSSTVSIAHHVTSDPEVATFDAVDEYLLLAWTGTEWETVKATATFV